MLFSNDKNKNNLHATLITNHSCSIKFEICNTCKQMLTIHFLLDNLVRFEFGVA